MIFGRSALTLKRLSQPRFSQGRKLTMLTLLALLLTCLSNLPAASAASTSDATNVWNQKLQAGEYRPNEVVVKFRDPVGGLRVTNAELHPEKLLQNALVQPYNVSQYDTFNELPGYVRYHTGPGTDLAQLMTAMSLDPDVEAVEPNYIRRIARGTNDTLYNQASNTSDPNTYRQWYLKKINMESLWDVTTGSNQVIAVVDTGINPYQDDLLGKVNFDRSFDFTRGDAPGSLNPRDNPVWDDNGHGTRVAGVIAANTNNGTGIAGINWNSILLSVKVLGSDGSGDAVTISKGIIYAADNQARIINLSLSGAASSFIESYAVQYAQNKGVLIVAASGNGSELVRPSYPAAYRNVIAVAATDRNDQVASFSNAASYISVAAPGVDIFSTSCFFLPAELRRSQPGVGGTPNRFDLYISQPCAKPDKYVGGRVDPCVNTDPSYCFHDYGSDSIYDYDSGTSFAAPIVTGLASLIIAYKPTITNDALKQLIEATADDIGTPGRDDYTGYGRVDAGNIAKALASGDYTPGHKAAVQGVVTGADLSTVVVNLDPPNQNKNINSDGTYRFDQLGNGVYRLRLAIPNRGIVLGPVTLYPTGQDGQVILVNFDVASGTISCGDGAVCPGNQNPSPGQPVVLPPPPANPLAPNSTFFTPAAPIPGEQYFQDTGHNLGGSFQAYWNAHGGLAIFGFPISEEFQEVSATDGRTYTVQYFQRNRFEFHPENNLENKVLLGLLGSESTIGQGRTFPPTLPVPNSATVQFFPETSHTLSGRFLEYWKANGGLPIFGYPISEPIQEGPYLVQYFERNRFELHPENQRPYDVLLGLLGVDLARSRNYIR